MKILVLGGTRFVGRAIVEAAYERGHQLTLFNRGSRPDLFPQVRRIAGDRNTDDVLQVAQDTYDCVVDVSGYRPSQVRNVLSALGRGIPHYVFISTVSVYAHPVPPGADEDAPLIEVDESVPSDDPRSYGGLKVLCERELRDTLDDRLTVLRPTVVIGPHDPTDRFPWWVRHAARGGAMPVPPRLEQPAQLIDTEDLAAFALRTIEQPIRGTFNTVGPRESLTLGGLIEILSETFGTQVVPEPVDPGEASSIPLTLAPDGSEDGAFMVSGEAAYREGLTLRPLGESAQAVRRAQQAAAESR